jgi:hypothetical protein
MEKRKTTGIDIGGWSSGQLSPLGRRGSACKHPQEDPGTGIHEASKRDVQRVTKKQTLDHVEGSTPSKTKKRSRKQRRSRYCRSTGLPSKSESENEREKKKERKKKKEEKL